MNTKNNVSVYSKEQAEIDALSHLVGFDILVDRSGKECEINTCITPAVFAAGGIRLCERHSQKLVVLKGKTRTEETSKKLYNRQYMLAYRRRKADG